MRSWLKKHACCITGGIGCLALCAAVLFPVVSVDHGSRRVTCTSNLKQIALAAEMYATDYDRRLNPAATWMDLLYPYVKNDYVYRCPTLSGTDPKAYGYAYNRLVSKRLLTNVPEPDSTPLAYDSNQLIRSAFDDVTSLPHPGRHNGGNNIAFVDGHVNWIRDTVSVIPLPR